MLENLRFANRKFNKYFWYFDILFLYLHCSFIREHRKFMYKK